jgi:uncharacterized protein
MRSLRVLPFLLLTASLAAAQFEVSPDVQALKAKAAAGDRVAQFELGMAYHDGKGVPVNDLKAAEWITKSAEQGYSPAQNELGILYRLGEGVDRDKPKSVEWFKKAAKQGNAKAMFNLGAAYYNGDGVGISDAVSLHWFLLAREYGDAGAGDAIVRAAQELNPLRRAQGYFLAGRALETGEELASAEPARALPFYEAAAKANHPEALLRMALFHLEGTAVPRNERAAMEYIRTMLKQKDPAAMVIMGKIEEEGIGRPADLKEAANWYKKAVQQAYPPAILRLAALYASGKIPKQDAVSAYQWFLIAEALDEPKGAEGRAAIEPQLTPQQIEKQKKKAVEWLTTYRYWVAAEKIDPEIRKKKHHF